MPSRTSRFCALTLLATLFAPCGSVRADWLFAQEETVYRTKDCCLATLGNDRQYLLDAEGTAWCVSDPDQPPDRSRTELIRRRCGQAPLVPAIPVPPEGISGIIFQNGSCEVRLKNGDAFFISSYGAPVRRIKDGKPPTAFDIARTEAACNVK